jgi:hypothetical protein
MPTLVHQSRGDDQPRAFGNSAARALGHRVDEPMQSNGCGDPVLAVVAAYG